MSELTLYHAPQTRSSAVLMLLEELAAPFELKLINLKAGEQRQPAYLAVNPMGKVPAIIDRGQLVTETVAIFLHLADRFPAAGLAPDLADPLRGPYLRWMVYYAAAFEPAIIDRANQHAPSQPSMSAYGDFDTMFITLNRQLAIGPWLLGDRFTAADVLWGSALSWTTRFQLVPLTAEVSAYIERFNARPIVQQVRVQDAGWVAQQTQQE